jgi:hypothetical protein
MASKWIWCKHPNQPPSPLALSHIPPQISSDEDVPKTKDVKKGKKKDKKSARKARQSINVHPPLHALSCPPSRSLMMRLGHPDLSHPQEHESSSDEDVPKTKGVKKGKKKDKKSARMARQSTDVHTPLHALSCPPSRSLMMRLGHPDLSHPQEHESSSDEDVPKAKGVKKGKRKDKKSARKARQSTDVLPSTQSCPPCRSDDAFGSSRPLPSAGA